MEGSEVRRRSSFLFLLPGGRGLEKQRRWARESLWRAWRVETTIRVYRGIKEKKNYTFER